MSLFSKRPDRRVQSFLLKLVNNNCPELKAMFDGPRADSRVNLVLVVMVIPLEDHNLQIPRTIMALTKEVSNAGVSVAFDQPYKMQEAILGFRFEGEMVYLRGETKHLSPMGGGFFQCGFKLTEQVLPSDYPELASMSF